MKIRVRLTYLGTILPLKYCTPGRRRRRIETIIMIWAADPI